MASSETGKEEKLEQSILIDLTDYFEGRFLKNDYSCGEKIDRIKIDLHSSLVREKLYLFLQVLSKSKRGIDFKRGININFDIS